MIRYEEPDEYGNDSIIIITEATAIKRAKKYAEGKTYQAKKKESDLTDKDFLEDFMIVYGGWEVEDIV